MGESDIGDGEDGESEMDDNETVSEMGYEVNLSYKAKSRHHRRQE